MTEPTEPSEAVVDDESTSAAPPTEMTIEAVPITEKSPHQRLREAHRAGYGGPQR